MKTGQNRKKPMNRGKIGEKGPAYIAKVGSVKVPVQRESDGEGGYKFRVTRSVPGKLGRQRKKFTGFEKAKSFANETVNTLAVGDITAPGSGAESKGNPY